MIKTLFILNLKALISNFMKIGKGDNGSSKLLLFAVVAVIVDASFVIISFSLFNSILEPFFSMGIGWMYFTMIAFMVFVMCVISTIFTASAQIFGAKDNELLFSMPIKASQILISRLLVFIMLEYIFAFIIAIPALVVWLNSEYTTAIGIVFFVTGIILLPLLSTVISLILAWLLGMITSRIRYKNFVTLAFSLLFFVAYFYSAFTLQSHLNNLLTRGEEIAEAFKKALPPFYHFGISVAESSVGDGIIFALWVILPFVAALALLMSNYKKIMTTNRGSVKIAYKEKAVKASNALSALVRKELANYWSKPFVILNTSLGSIVMIVASVFIIVKKSDALSFISELAPVIGDIPPVILAATALAFLNATNNISSSLISLEGNKLWIAKSIPVSHLLVLQSKVCTHLLISGLPCVVASLCAAITFAQSPADWLLILLLPQVTCILIAVGGIAINLNYPKLEWTNEIQVVKQGASSMITMLGSMGILIGIRFVYSIFLSNIFTFTEFLWICTALFAIGAVGVYVWLAKVGVKVFAKL